jgi:hypothetical protein
MEKNVTILNKVWILAIGLIILVSCENKDLDRADRKDFRESTQTDSSIDSVKKLELTDFDCDQFFKAYEVFVSHYVTVLRKYKSDPTNTSALSDYSEAIEKAEDMRMDAYNCTEAKYAIIRTKLSTKIANAGF